MTPRISVIIPFRDARQLLPTLVGALRAQTLARISSRCSGWTMDPATMVACGCTIICLPGWRLLASGGRRGSYAARNIGLRAAGGDNVAFTDVDCRPHEDWLEQGLVALAAAPRVAGRIDLEPLGIAFHRRARRRRQVLAPASVRAGGLCRNGEPLRATCGLRRSGRLHRGSQVRRRPGIRVAMFAGGDSDPVRPPRRGQSRRQGNPTRAAARRANASASAPARCCGVAECPSPRLRAGRSSDSRWPGGMSCRTVQRPPVGVIRSCLVRAVHLLVVSANAAGVLRGVLAPPAAACAPNPIAANGVTHGASKLLAGDRNSKPVAGRP